MRRSEQTLPKHDWKRLLHPTELSRPNPVPTRRCWEGQIGITPDFDGRTENLETNRVVEDLLTTRYEGPGFWFAPLPGLLLHLRAERSLHLRVRLRLLPSLIGSRLETPIHCA